MASDRIKARELVSLTPIQRRMVLIIEQVNGAASARELLSKFNRLGTKPQASR